MSQLGLAVGTRLGPYEILAPIGAGGMGEVYRATDTRLHRVVAIKVIGRTHAHDPDLRARFRVEAEAIAALTHPHICRLYDVGEHEDVEFLVMEYLEGETLAARLARGRLPLHEAITFAIAISAALEHAHRQGIVHRDVKPANVMLTRTGPKLLDFGLARLRSSAPAPLAGASTVARAPGVTEPGDALGTWQYMAPEQVRGEHADTRTDVFALGSLVYEMLTGRRPFVGATHHDLVIAILEQQPPSLRSVDATIPIALDRIVASCLAKDPADRWQSAGDVRRALDAIQSVEGSPTAVVMPRSRRWLAAVALSVILVAVAFAFRWSTAAPPHVDKVVRSVMPLSPEALVIGAGALAFAPDGKSFVYKGRTASREQLYRRTLEGEGGEPIAGTEDGSGPFFSPDGQWLGFSLADRLMKVPAGGGRPVEITNAAAAYGASWGSDDAVVFSPRAQTGLLRVPASGGPAKTVTTLAPEDESNDHRWPQVLPGGRGIIFTVGTGPEDAARIVALDLRSGARTDLVRGSASARYVPSGHLVYAREAQLFALPFDVDRLVVTGPPVRMANGVAESDEGAPEYAFSPDGDLVYAPGTSGGAQLDVSLVDMKGTVEPTAVATGVWPSVSPDGRRIAVTFGGAKNNVWIYDRDRKTSTRVTFGRYHWPVWMSDGRLTLAHGGPGDLRIVRRATDGGGSDEELVPASGRAQYPETWTPDGRTLFYRRSDRGQWDLWRVSPGVSPPEPFLVTPFNELNSRVSPDGKWLAYASNENGRSEIYVRSLHGDPPQRQQVSAHGAVFAIWAPDSRRLYYRGTVPGATVAGIWTAVIDDAARLRVSAPRLMFSNPGFQNLFDITPDGAHFVMTTTDRTPPRQQVNLVLNSLGVLAQTPARD